TPSASSTSAEPHREVNERLPCFATEAPAPAATNAAAVEMLKVETVPPPVPQVSTRWSPAASTGIITARSARAAPATSSAVSPLTRRPMSRAAICAGVASPRITVPKTAVVWLSVSERRFASAAIASSNGTGAEGDGGASGIGISGSPKLPRKIAFCQMGQRVAWLDWPPVSSYLSLVTSRPFLAVVHYDGGGFVGWQRQRAGRTVQADFEAVLERLTGQRTTATGAGRTDTGVHALGQGVGFVAAERGARAAWAPRTYGAGVTFTIEADRFLQRMVRFLVGAMVDVDLGRRPPADRPRLLTATDNQAASPPAPPQGLYLMAVRYPADLYAEAES